MRRFLFLVFIMIGCLLTADNSQKNNVILIRNLIDKCQYKELAEKLEEMHRADPSNATYLIPMINTYLKMGKFDKYEELLGELYNQSEKYISYKNMPPFDAAHEGLINSYYMYKSLSKFYQYNEFKNIVKSKDNLKYGTAYEEAYILACIMLDSEYYRDICENADKHSYYKYYCLLARKNMDTYENIEKEFGRKHDSNILDYCNGKIQTRELIKFVNKCYHDLPVYRNILLQVIEHVDSKTIGSN